jgi:hypothetical protein
VDEAFQGLLRKPESEKADSKKVGFSISSFQLPIRPPTLKAKTLVFI